MNELTNLFPPEAAGVLNDLFLSPEVSQIEINNYQEIFYTDRAGKYRVNVQVFSSNDAYLDWLDWVISNTDVAGVKVRTHTTTPVIEGSFAVDPVAGSLHICLPEVTRSAPITTIRKQPMSVITLDEMVEQNMLSKEIAHVLRAAIKGRLNLLISGGSGTGKTTLARALSSHIEPMQRVVTVEEISELRLADRVANVVPLTAASKHDETGRLVRETSVGFLVREALRMRADRIWVGEIRGPEAYALATACTSGHDGGLSTIHANDAIGAAKTATTHIQAAGIPEETARDLVARAFHLIIHLEFVRPGVRRVTEVLELASAVEGSEYRRANLFRFDRKTDTWSINSRPSDRIIQTLLRNGVQL